MPKPKKPVRSNEQIAQEQALKEKQDRLHDKLKNEILPFLKKMKSDVNTTSTFVAVLTMTIKQALQFTMRDKTVLDLNIGVFLDKKNPDFQKWIDVLKILEGEKISEALALTEKMSELIDVANREEAKKRPFSKLDIPGLS